MAQDLLDRFFRDAEGKTNRQIDVYFTLEDMGIQRDRAEEGLEYLTSRGLINMFGPDVAFLTELGVASITEDKNISKLAKQARDFAQARPTPSASSPQIVAARPPPEQPKVEAPSTTEPPQAPLPPHSSKPQLRFSDPDGNNHLVELGWSCTIGRVEGNTIHLQDQRASKKHAELKFEGGKYVLNDLGAANGTLVNGSYIDQHVLRHGDQILIGRTTLVFEAPRVITAPPIEKGAVVERAAEPAPQQVAPTERPAPAADPRASQSQEIRVVKGRPDSVRTREAPALKRPASQPPQRPEEDLFAAARHDTPIKPRVPPFPGPARGAEDPEDLFAQPSQPSQRESRASASTPDLFREDTQRPIPRAPMESRPSQDLFREEQRPGAKRSSPDLFREEPKPAQRPGRAQPPSQDLFHDDNAQRSSRSTPSQDLFHDDSAQRRPPTSDLFEGDTARRPALPGGDLFDDQPPPQPERHEPSAHDLFAEAALPRPSPQAPSNLFDDEPNTVFAKTDHKHRLDDIPIEAPDTMEPLAPMNPLEAIEPIEPMEQLEPMERLEPLEEPVIEAPLRHVDDLGSESTLVNTSLQDLARESGVEIVTPWSDHEAHTPADELAAEPMSERSQRDEDLLINQPVSHDIDLAGLEEVELSPEVHARGRVRGEVSERAETVLSPGGAALGEEAEADTEGATPRPVLRSDTPLVRDASEELPRWGDERQSQPAGSHPAFAQGSAQHIASIEREEPGEDLPEANAELADLSLSGAPVPSALEVQSARDSVFHRTLRSLRQHVERADLPDKDRVLAAIDLLERHPYVRVALNLSEPDR